MIGGRSATAALSFIAAIGLALPVGATSMVKLDDEDLSHIADVIVVGEVQQVKPELTVRGGRTTRLISTRTVVKVSESWKGAYAAGDSIAIREVGGVLGNEMVEAPSTAGFLVGEKVLVFLNYDPDTNELWLVGWTQGKFSLLPDGGGDYHVAKIPLRVEEWGGTFDLAREVGRARKLGTKLGALSTRVKRIVEQDEKNGVNWREMPKYKGLSK